MERQLFGEKIATTPAFVIDETDVRRRLQSLALLREESGCKVLYSMKALPLQSILELAIEVSDGISVSSLFEARLARECIADHGSVHLTTPGLRQEEFPELSELCSHVSFNSTSQWRTMAGLGEAFSPGLRLNPKVSFVYDQRYDPCRSHSKLGVDIDSLDTLDGIEQLEGVHFHTVFSSPDFTPMSRTVEIIRYRLLNKMRNLKWLNLGGGYLFSQIEQRGAFIELVQGLRWDYAIDVYIEPGNDVVKQAGYLVSTVIDRFDSGGKTVAILDTSVNHNPEVFEYQYQPELLRQSLGDVPIILAGSTCLAGDLFGEYGFASKPEVGDRIVFKHCGAYSLIKAHRFNGYNLPDIYNWDGKNFHRLKHYDYQDYRRQWLVNG